MLQAPFSRLQARPCKTNTSISSPSFGFKKIFGEPTRAERQAYEDSLKYYRDLKNGTDTAWFEGREVGLKQAITALHAKGFDPEFIAITLNLPLASVQEVLVG